MSSRSAPSAPPAVSDLQRQAEQLLETAGLSSSVPADSAPTVSSAVQQSDVRDVSIAADLAEGRTYRDVAARHGVSHATVGRVAAKLETYEAGARKYLIAKALGAVDDWTQASANAARRGDHRPARDLLLHAGVIEPLADTSGQRSTQIAIVIGEPGRPVRVSGADTET